MEHNLYGGQIKVWHMLKNRKKTVNKYIQTTAITLEKWERHFQDLHNTAIRNQSEQTEPGTPPTHWTITKEKIKFNINT